jgi:hypothetical protein
MAVPLEGKGLLRILPGFPIIGEDKWIPIDYTSDPSLLDSQGDAMAVSYHFFGIYVEAPTSFQESTG